ncbi:interferon regulatory factor 3 isoform X2 [Dermochelys coriacea]|uniref:interferon regulatory factor 3 isoform X2 n=1 Tax=Dermochelys coriacea TaxID=27794 RepID=UPI0018E79A71|nr:interferon regulatory factor 3 isoform X2 [Dermochelys coriacea]
MGTPKPLIVPWLRKKLDDRCYPGDWAIDSGNYRPGHDAPMPSIWKRNFRSALNRKPGIQVLQDHSSDSVDPHKIYEILPNGARAGADEAPSAAVGGTEADMSSQLLDRSGGSFSCSQDDELDAILNTLALSSPEEDAPCSALAPGAPYVSDAATGVALSPGFGDFPPLGPPAPSSLEQLLGSNVLMTDFEVRVYYRGHLVLQTLVPNPQGFRLVSTSPGPSPCPELVDVELPGPGALLDRVQASYTARLLQGLAAGVLVRVQGPALCATRLGRLHAYWGRTETPEPGAEGGELSKEGYTLLYDMSHFVRELICFIEGQGSSPTYELWLCLGEAWPDVGRSWKKKLIMVQVVPTVLRTLHELSQAGGASSLRGEELDLRISDSLGEAGLLGALRDWEERMESQPYS